MLTSIHDTEDAVAQTLRHMNSAPVEFRDQDWQLMKKVVRVLKPFKEATLMLSEKDASISTAIPVATLIIQSLEEEDRQEDMGVLTMKRDLKKNMKTRFSHLETEFHYTAATLLDSKFKHLFYQDPDTLQITKDHIVDKMVHDLESSQMAANREVRKYMHLLSYCHVIQFSAMA